MPLRRAATVVLLRDSPAGPEVYLLRRVASMAFAASMHVFPGGGVDPRDADDAVGWAGPAPAVWAARLRCDEATARASVCAAVRETFEESGVLLAGPDARTVVADLSDPSWEADRLALVDRSLALTELLERRRLVLRADLLAVWGHWITPRFELRRYDTHFYVAAVPAGQSPRHVSGEAAEAGWFAPREALSLVAAGRLPMLPPTRITLAEVAPYSSVADVLAAAPGRTVRPLLPGWVVDGESVRMVLPDDPRWPGDDRGGPR